MNKQLVEYIRKQLNSGYKPEDIRKAVIKQGWPQAEVDEAINHLLPSKQAPPKKTTQAPLVSPKKEPHKHGISKKIILLIAIAVIFATLLPVVLIALGLYQFGMFNPGTLQPSTSTGFSSIGEPTGWEYNYDELTVIFQNNVIPEKITITKATAEGCSGLTTNQEIEIGESFQLKFTDCPPLASGSTYFVGVEITYKRENGFLTVSTGTLTGTAI